MVWWQLSNELDSSTDLSQPKLIDQYIYVNAAAADDDAIIGVV